MAAVMDANRTAPPYFIYTAADWNPQTYEESCASTTPAHIAYRGAKKYAEKEAWEFMVEKEPEGDGESKVGFDLVTLCPSMSKSDQARSSQKKYSWDSSSYLMQSEPSSLGLCTWI